MDGGHGRGGGGGGGEEEEEEEKEEDEGEEEEEEHDEQEGEEEEEEEKEEEEEEGREATKLRKVEGSLRHLAGSSANSGSLGKLERPLLMLLPTRKSHALHWHCIPGRKSFT